MNKNEVGIIGEIHPEVLTSFKLEVPIAVFEISLSSIIGVKNL